MSKLSNRQLDVLTLVGNGASNGVIATELCITRYTVKNHLMAVKYATDTRGRTQAVVWALAHGYLKIEDGKVCRTC